MQFRWAGFDATQRLTAEEATELAARVAALTKAGLPLGAGLRALADELSGWRLPRVLRHLADRLDAGDDLVAALEAERSLPTHLRGLMLAGIRSGRLADMLEEFVDLQRGQFELHRRLWLSLAYPFILLLFLTGLAALAANISGGFAKIFDDFETNLPVLTVITIKMSQPMFWLFAILVCASAALPLLLWLAPAASWAWPVLHRVPMLGPLLRWSHLAQLTRWMSLLLDQQVTLPDALRLSAAGLHDANLARGCRRVADEVEQGRALDESMAARRQFPASMIPLVQWGLRAPALPDAFRGAAEMFDGRVRSQGTLLETMLLPIVLLLIAIFVGAFIVAMLLPLISLIQGLSY